jgi:transcriptional antiterminator RfaH
LADETSAAAATAAPTGRWAVACLVPQFAADRRALDSADRLGFRSYYPRYVHRVRRPGYPPEDRVRPVFPSYLFLFLVDAWHQLLGAPGIRSLLMDGESPAVLPEHEVERLRVMEDAAGFIRLPKVSAECFAQGAKVRVESGPFRGLSGLYEGMSSRGREMLLLELLGGSRLVEVAEGTALAAA